jgi:hypothetical protein
MVDFKALDRNSSPKRHSPAYYLIGKAAARKAAANAQPSNKYTVSHGNPNPYPGYNFIGAGKR